MSKDKMSSPCFVASNGHLDVHVVRPGRFGGDAEFPVKVGLHHRTFADPRAAFAQVCIERWAMVAAEVDGEDSAGRAKLRRMTADEVVAHACACAEKAFAEFERRCWLVNIPPISTLVDAIQDQENTND